MHGLRDMRHVITSMIRCVWAMDWRGRVMRTCPDAVQDILSVLTMLLKLLVDFRCLGGLIENLARRGWPGGVLIGRTRDFMSWSLNTAIVSRRHICDRCRRCRCRCRHRHGRCRRHGRRRHRHRGNTRIVGFGVGHRDAARSRVETTKGLHRIHGGSQVVRVVAAIRSRGMSKSHGAGVIGLGGSSLPCLGRARSLLAGRVFFGEALLLGLGFPVIVAYAASVGDQSAPKLAEHGPSGDNGNLARSVRVGQNFLVDQVILFGLGGDDLEQGAVLVEEQV